MKWNVFNLKVMKRFENDQEHYLICRETAFENTYKEILTGERILEENPTRITELCKYYSVFEVMNLKTGKALMLNKKDILRKGIQINQHMAKEKQKKLQLG